MVETSQPPFGPVSLEEFIRYLKSARIPKFSFQGLNVEQRRKVHDDLELQHISKGPINQRIITVAALDTVLGTPTAARSIRSELLKCTNYEIPNSPAVTSIIGKNKTPAVKGKRGRLRKNKETGETGKIATQQTEESEKND